ncbi:histidine kinase [Microbacterium panaciterrae]|uniref:histidine kinase n=1 Tax=Microbacterium panaciterrae TaxID=985759 RepID=A0ABP8PTI6_9MICO
MECSCGGENREVSITKVERTTLVWFLRGQLLDRVVLILTSAAIVTEFFVLLLSGEPLLDYVGLLVGAAGVVLCRFRRMLGLVVVVLGAVAAALLATEYVAMWTVVVFTLFSVTVRGSRAIPALLIAGIPVYLSIVIRDGWNFQSPVALIATACCAVGAAVGSAVRAQQRYLESMRQRALDAEAAAGLAVERGIAEERLRIARDLHDAVGHEVAVVSMNLGAAEVQLPQESVGAREALTAARAGIQRVLREMQQILDVLRRGEDGGDRDPVADARRIPDLIETMRASGTVIEASLDDTGGLDSSVSTAMFRLVQEALTNAQRHGTGTIRISLTAESDELIVDVQNKRSSAANASERGSGYGLVGMRERAQSVGGHLEVVEDANTFRVRAVLKRGTHE